MILKPKVHVLISSTNNNIARKYRYSTATDRKIIYSKTTGIASHNVILYNNNNNNIIIISYYVAIMHVCMGVHLQDWK